MAHRTDPAVLSGITTNPTCIRIKKKGKNKQKKVNHFMHFFAGIQAHLQPSDSLSYCDINYFVSLQVLHTIAFFQIPISLRNCHPYQENVKPASSFHPL